MENMFNVFSGSDRVNGGDVDAQKFAVKRATREEEHVRDANGDPPNHNDAAAADSAAVEIGREMAADDRTAESKRSDKKSARKGPLPRPRSHPVKVRIKEGTNPCTHDVSLPVSWEDKYDFSELEVQSLAKSAKQYPFSLDSFQSEAIKCLERKESVLVSAHTSAGKTVVAEYAIAMSLRDKQRVIYTSPIKALSNQKYRELHEQFEDVGLMTGDITISPHSSALVMTTEILRSMLYRGSEIIREIAWVIFDEVHYMRDKERGVVWEEAIIMVPKDVRFVFLSATIPNADEFSEWIAQIKQQPCHTIYTDMRPVPLQHYLYPDGGEGLHLVVDEKGHFREANFERAMADIARGAENNRPGGGGVKKLQRRGRGAKGASGDVYKVVKLIRDRNYDPVIVFAFSRRDCENLALQMSSLDFNDEQEKVLVTEVFTHAMDSLSEEDKKLPQITAALPLLQNGIGIHHSGLLPILKEVVEILFGEGLIKALFATETFSMGLNMPAKTVVFVAARKFDGDTFRWLTGGEYIQMSGRAGRRGLDERGVTILMFDEKMEPEQAKSILLGQADPLKSTFHLGYNMLLNLLRSEEADPELVIRKSFAQFQADISLPDNERKLEEADQKRKAIDLAGLEEELAEHKRLVELRDNLRAEVRDIIFKPQYIVPFLQPGRIVRVVDFEEKMDFEWGVILNFTKRTYPNRSTHGGSAPTDRYTADVLLRVVPSDHGSGSKPRAPTNGDAAEWEVVPCPLKMFDRISAIRVFIPKDLRQKDSRAAVGKSVNELRRRTSEQVQDLDPIEDLRIQEPKFVELMRKVETVEDKLSASKLDQLIEERKISRTDLFERYERKLALDKEHRALRLQVKLGYGTVMHEELKRMKRVLRRLGFISSSDIVEIKGRTACEVNTADELVLTELMLSGSFNDMSPEVVLSLLSCFVFDEKSDESLQLEPALAAAHNVLKQAATRVGEVTLECKVPIDLTEYVQSFQPGAMPVMYAWAKGDTFEQLCKMTTMFEGSIIRCMRRLEELLMQLRAATKSVGNTELQEKFEQASAKLKRGVAFQASLYL